VVGNGNVCFGKCMFFVYIGKLKGIKKTMLTYRFYQIRKKELEDLFSKKNISVVWRKVVRDQLRRVDILDTFDYYDFNYNLVY
jgi:hypothetical protein